MFYSFNIHYQIGKLSHMLDLIYSINRIRFLELIRPNVLLETMCTHKNI